MIKYSIVRSELLFFIPASLLVSKTCGNIELCFTQIDAHYFGTVNM